MENVKLNLNGFKNNKNQSKKNIDLNNEISEIINDKIFYNGYLDNYDMILNFNSFEQLRKDGWTANFSIGGYKKYLHSSKDNNVVIGVIGIKNSGKSFILRRIMEKIPNFKPKDGFLVDTYGISCIFPEDSPFVILDTQGIDKALLKSSYNENNNIKPKNNIIKSIIRDQKVCELLLSDYY